MSEHDYETVRRRLAETAASAAPYREEMWRDVSRAWSAELARRRRVRAALGWAGAGLGLAAALVIGIFIGRSGGGGGEPAAPAPVETTARAATLPVPYRIVVGEHLRDAEMLLASFDASGQVDVELSRSARELAAATRLLLDSRAGEDAEARRLLLDVELLLLQISRLVEEGDPTENQVVREGLEESTVLPRLKQSTYFQGV